ncbi:MAG: Lrp/AsnC family transcriptional regulator [Steroidobacteraceae bacterium]
MDKYDREILEHLQADGRISVTALAERIALSPSATLRRVQALEAAGVIAGYRAILDAQKLGHEVRAFVEVNADRANPEQVAQFLRRVAAMPEVLSCYMVSGSIDFVLEVVAPSLLAYADFIDNRLLKLRGVKDASSRLVLRTIKPPSPYSVR